MTKFSNSSIIDIAKQLSDKKICYVTINKSYEAISSLLTKNNIKLNNFSSLEFSYNELISFDKVIPLSDGAKKIYKDEGLIYYKEDDRCVL